MFEGVERFEVTRLLDGGRSGSCVVQVHLYRGDHRLMHVVKIGPAAALSREAAAYQRWIKPAINALFAPILAVTPDDPSGEAWGIPAAVVYDHVGQHAGTPEVGVRTLEEVVRAAANGPDARTGEVVALVNTLFGGAAHVLYNRYAVAKQATSLRSQNLTLGPNVTVTVDNVDENGRLHYGRPDAARARAALLPDDEILLRSLAGQEDDLTPGDLLTIGGLRPERLDGTLVARGDNIVVEIRVEPGSGHRVDLAALAARPDLSVCGLITATRGRTNRERLVAAAGEFGKTFADPFSALKNVLTVPAGGRVRSYAHGDLNPRNVVLVGDRPYLIDYEHTSDDLPQTGDCCWLEVGLLRDVFAANDLAALIGLQRVLALGCRLLQLGAISGRIEHVCLDLLGKSALRSAFRVLWAIRAQAHRHYPADAGELWWQSHFGQLLITAHRMVKWPGQPEEKLRASVAVAAVASEWLGEANPFRFWPPADLAEAFRVTAPLLNFDHDDAVRLGGDLITAMESHGKLSRSTESLLSEQRVRLVKARGTAAADRTVLALAEDHARYVGLPVRASETDAVNLVARQHTAVIVGGPGSGKTATAREFAYLLAAGVNDHPTELAGLAVRAPVLFHASVLLQQLSTKDELCPDVFGPVSEAASTFGAVHLIVDGLDELPSAGQFRLTEALHAFRVKYPRVPMVVCGRSRIDDPAFAAIELRELDLADMRRFLRRVLGSGGTPGDDVDQLLASLLDNPDWRRVDLRRPAILRLVAESVRDVGSPSDLRWPESAFVGRVPNAALVVQLQTLAAKLFDDGVSTLPVEDAQSLFEPGEEPLSHLVATGVIRAEGGLVRFTDRMHQDYYGAGALLNNRESVHARILHRTWHGAFLVFVAFSGMVAETLSLVSFLSPTAPRLAGQLLRAARITELISFADTQAQVLGDPGAGPVAWREAAAALCEIGEPGRLATAAADSRADARSRQEALLSLVELHDRTLSPDERRATTRTLKSTVHGILREQGPPDLRATALRVIGGSRLRGLELFAGECLGPEQPWPVVRGAMAMLDDLGIALPDASTRAYHAACQVRVEEIERVLPATASARTARALRTELVDLVRTLADVEPVSWLLHRRFAFDLSSTVAGLLDERLPDATTDPAEWLDRLDDPEAAHRLLRDAPELAVDVLKRTCTDAPSERLLITAAAVGPDSLEIAERLFRDLVPIVRGDQLPGLAGLLSAIHTADRSLGVTLAWTAALALAERDLPERHLRPWATALARSRGSFADFEAMLGDGGESGRLAVEALASYDFLRSAAPGPRHELSPAARERLLNLRPSLDSPPREMSQWILAAATARLTEALPVVLDEIDRHPIALTASGYLARLLSDTQDLTHQRLQDHDNAEIGLAYLGDWEPLLTMLPPDNVAARNTIEHWVPGPFTSAHSDIAAWIASRVSDPTLPNDHRWLLAELKEVTERRTGTLIR